MARAWGILVWLQLKLRLLALAPNIFANSVYGFSDPTLILVLDPTKKARASCSGSGSRTLWLYERKTNQGKFPTCHMMLLLPAFCHLTVLTHQHHLPHQKVVLTLRFFLGGLAGMCGWAVAIPFDNLKNRHQVCLGNFFKSSAVKFGIMIKTPLLRNKNRICSERMMIMIIMMT